MRTRTKANQMIINHRRGAKIAALKKVAKGMRRDGIDCRVVETWGEAMLVVRTHK